MNSDSDDGRDVTPEGELGDKEEDKVRVGEELERSTSGEDGVKRNRVVF